MAGKLRGDIRNDPALKTVLNDPDVVAALDAHTQSMRRRVREKVETALQSTDGRKLKSWVAVAVWEDEDGTTTEHVTSDDHTSVLEVRSLLHGALWVASHPD